MDIAMFKVAVQAGAAALNEMHLYAWMATSIVNQKGREQVFDNLRGGTNAEDPGFATLEFARPLTK
jgi:hypothetical protein